MSFPYTRILCPVDFDDNSMHALDQAVALAGHFKAAIGLVHVVPLVIQYGDVPIPYEYYEEEQRAARTRLREIAAEKFGANEHHIMLYTGDIVGGILRAIKEFNPDLAVMATHGRSGLSHFFLGSVAEAVLRKATCPVLTIRAISAEADTKPDHP